MEKKQKDQVIIMPVKITRSRMPLSMVDAVVQPVYPKKRILFGARVGSVTLSPAGTAGKYELRVVCPHSYSEEGLRRGYEQCVRLARRKGLSSLQIPLLLPENEDADRRAALHLAMRTLGDETDDHPMEVFLTVLQPEALQMGALQRQALTAYIERNYRVTQHWSPMPFPSDADRFDTKPPVLEESRCYADASFAPEPLPPMPSMAPAPAREKKLIIEEPDAGFSETLLKLIDKTGKKDSEIYNRANVSRQHFSKIRNNPDYKPTKPTAIAFAVALELDMDQTLDLIGRAGYTLTRSSRFDLIIMYFIERRNYNMFDINEALFEFDQSLLGA